MKIGSWSLRRDPRVYLFDVLEAANNIVGFTSGMDGQAYEANRLVAFAVERNFEIIGEALNQLSRVDPVLANQIPQLAKIVGFRNILIHGYAMVDQQRVWALTRTDLLGLRSII